MSKILILMDSRCGVAMMGSYLWVLSLTPLFSFLVWDLGFDPTLGIFFLFVVQGWLILLVGGKELVVWSLPHLRTVVFMDGFEWLALSQQLVCMAASIVPFENSIQVAHSTTLHQEAESGHSL
jgi:hypothetical protein